MSKCVQIECFHFGCQYSDCPDGFLPKQLRVPELTHLPGTDGHVQTSAVGTPAALPVHSHDRAGLNGQVAEGAGIRIQFADCVDAEAAGHEEGLKNVHFPRSAT